MWFLRSVLPRIPVGAVLASWCALWNFKIMFICLGDATAVKLS